MTVLALTQSLTAVGSNGFSSFLGIGGVPPYTYALAMNGAGGAIDATTGAYNAPDVVSSNPIHAYDTVIVTDSTAATASSRILVGTPLILLCDIIQVGMGLYSDQIWLWESKINIPTDSRLYVAVSVPNSRPFGNINGQQNVVDGGLNQVLSVNMVATIDIDILSRGPEARDRKEEVILVLKSTYAEQQQEANSFFIGSANNRMINLSSIDGAAIPYRYKITVQMQYMKTITLPSPYFDTFQQVQTTINS